MEKEMDILIAYDDEKRDLKHPHGIDNCMNSDIWEKSWMIQKRNE